MSLLLNGYAFEGCLSKRHKKLQSRNGKICSVCKGGPNKEVIKRLGLAPLGERFGKVLPSIRPKATDQKNVPVNQSKITYPT